jgi:ABC-type multidrug transport system fused ATPase/permease subunit
MLTSAENTWTMMAVSNDPVVMASCDRVIVLKDGVKIGEGTFQDLMKTNLLNECLD